MVRIRPARQEDCLTLWEWANDPETRRQAFDKRPIPKESHVQWFNGKLADPNCAIYIVETDDDQAVGQVRFDLQEDGTAVIDFSIDTAMRGRGYGSTALREASRLLIDNHPVASVAGLVKPDNVASLRAFEKAGFRRGGRESVSGQPAIRMALAREEIVVG